MSHAHEHGGHDHSHHDHGHGANDRHDDHDHDHHRHHGDASERRLLIALGLLGFFTLVEAAGGYLANSIALLGEAAHMLADSASLVLAIVAIRVGRRPADARRTYGHRRYQPLAAFVNGQALLLLSGWILYQAILRLAHHQAVDGRLMLVIAVVGGLANLAAFLALAGASSLNERGARVHVLSDLLGSAAASAAAVAIIARGWTIADPLLSLVVSALVIRSGWRLVRESADVLLESVPSGFDVKRVEAELIRHVPGITGVHDVHVWSITGERPMVTLHADLLRNTEPAEALSAIHRCLRESLNIEHCTVQIELEGRCEMSLSPTEPNACA
jgi:cobalt-zinc-cadmium efflux system protein